MSARLGVNLTWATPVRPDLLGAHLEALEMSYPTLTALRLCHRFGQGADAYITKLPAELLLAVEEFVVERARSVPRLTWMCNFTCFEGRCTPVQHVSGHCIEETIWDEVDWCHACLNDHYEGCMNKCGQDAKSCLSCQTTTADNTSCSNSCSAQFDEARMDHALICETAWDDHHDKCSEWASASGLTKQKELLRNHFGLELVCFNARQAEKGQWTEHANHYWHDGEGMFDCAQTTVCHITLPRPPSDMIEIKQTGREADAGYFHLAGGRTFAINIIKTLSTEKLARFNRAMNLLGLEPHVHPSQGYSTLLTDHKDDELDKETQTKSTSKWPQLLLMANVESFSE